ncbi:PREDICTED: olfactory receptor 6F1-like [Nanorana parkeri]|uniref:olfactory receptor 6F1-like n=1 Tax=Nanorana parkeri TaxID=125878 RepID=UPI0008548A9C|nr:PREDICTED: olfactory receptor 6F1-like [Nanorana parkeri]
MNTGNESQMAEFILLGFPSSRGLQLLLFVVLLGFYLLTISANLLIIGTIILDVTLRKIPMYIFLCHFSFLEIWYITATVPKMLVDIIADNNIISYKGCITQIYFFFALGLTELFFLAMMGYDRYLAICHPLHYNSIMTSKRCNQMAMCSWICGFSSSLLLTIPSSRLLFCGPKVINHFFYIQWYFAKQFYLRIFCFKRCNKT